jgi:hypothetical protein
MMKHEKIVVPQMSEFVLRHYFVIASRLPPLTLSGCGHLAPLPAGSIRHSSFSPCLS